MNRIKKNDKVIVKAGKDKGKSGKVLKVFPAKGRVIVEGINLVKKTMRRRSEAESGGMQEVPAPLNISNVSILCPNCNQGVRIGVKVMKDKTKARICRKCEKTL
jgi:large subunit ribosomal protein L24